MTRRFFAALFAAFLLSALFSFSATAAPKDNDASTGTSTQATVTSPKDGDASTGTATQASSIRVGSIFSSGDIGAYVIVAAGALFVGGAVGIVIAKNSRSKNKK